MDGPWADEEEEADADELLVGQQGEPVLAAAVLGGWVGRLFSAAARCMTTLILVSPQNFRISGPRFSQLVLIYSI